MEFRILGPLEVYDGERLLPLGGAKQRSLLAMLLLNANKVVSVEGLLDALWGERQPASGAKTLHVYVSQLRKALADQRVVTQPPGYFLRVDPGELDETRFSALRAKAGSARAGRGTRDRAGTRAARARELDPAAGSVARSRSRRGRRRRTGAAERVRRPRCGTRHPRSRSRRRARRPRRLVPRRRRAGDR